MGPVVDVVPSSAEFPQRTEVVVIGGGIVGVATALALVLRDVPTVLLEKGSIAGEQSSRNWGWVRQSGRDLRELPLMRHSLERWAQMNSLTEAETGFRRGGILYSTNGEAQRERQLRWLSEARQFDIHGEMLSTAQMLEKLPGLQNPPIGGLFTPLDGRAEPQKAAPAMAMAAMARGLNLQQHCAVRSVERSGGRISAVHTEHGRIDCQSVVVAGGVWSRLLLQGMGITLPQLKVMTTVLRTRASDLPVEPCVSFGKVALRKRLDGGFTVASSAHNTADITPDSLRFGHRFLPAFWHERKAIRLRAGRQFVDELLHWRPGAADKPSIYERIRVLDPVIDPARVAIMMQDLRERIPASCTLQVAQSWGGMIDSMPDAIPVISEVAQTPGLFIATGFSGHGFGIAPGAGELMADLVTGSTPVVDATPFRFSRFSDGEKVAAQFWL